MNMKNEDVNDELVNEPVEIKIIENKQL